MNKHDNDDIKIIPTKLDVSGIVIKIAHTRLQYVTFTEGHRRNILRFPSRQSLDDTAFYSFLFVLRLNVNVNNFLVMSGRSQRFLALTNTVGS